MPRIAALTGATGFIGSHLKQYLADHGWRLRALTRKPAASHPPSDGIEWIEGDLGDLEALGRLVRGADAVVHCAGLVKARRAGDFFRVNADGAHRLARIAAQQDKAPRFVLLSSLAAREPGLSAYAASKRRAEDILRADPMLLAATILRPPAVYGPGDRETLTVYRALRRGLAPLPGGGRGRLSLIHVSDLAAAVAAILDTESTAGRLIEVDDGKQDGYTLRAMLEIVARHLGVRPRFVPVPELVLRAVGALNLAAAFVAGYAPMLTPGKARELCHPDWVCRDRSLTRLTPWRARLKADEGLGQTIDWYRRHDLL